MYVNVQARKSLRGLRGFFGQPAPVFPYRLGLGGFYGQPKPVYPYRLGCPGCRGLGQDDGGDDSGLFYTPGAPGVIQAGGPTYEPGGGTIAPPDVSASGIPLAPSGGLTPAQLLNLAITPMSTPGMIPSVAPGTLLSAATLPGAPAVVKAAAAQYSAANPVSAAVAPALSSTVGGIPTLLLVGGGALLLVVVMSKKRKK